MFTNILSLKGLKKVAELKVKISRSGKKKIAKKLKNSYWVITLYKKGRRGRHKIGDSKKCETHLIGGYNF